MTGRGPRPRRAASSSTSVVASSVPWSASRSANAPIQSRGGRGDLGAGVAGGELVDLGRPPGMQRAGVAEGVVGEDGGDRRFAPPGRRRCERVARTRPAAPVVPQVGQVPAELAGCFAKHAPSVLASDHVGQRGGTIVLAPKPGIDGAEDGEANPLGVRWRRLPRHHQRRSVRRGREGGSHDPSLVASPSRSVVLGSASPSAHRTQGV